MSAHRKGSSLPNQLLDRDAARRHGISQPQDCDHGELYDGEEVLFPIESRATFDGKRQVGWCSCGFAAVEDAHGTGLPACVYCGSYLETSR